jgi:hypothetical protein
MCYSKEVSQRSFIINVITCYILYNYNSNNSTHKILALFFAFVGLMQLFDWIFWEHQGENENDKRINFIFTKIAMIANHIQPIILAILLYIYYGKLPILSICIVLLYTIVVVPYTTNLNIDYTLVKNIKTKKNKTKTSLYWQWNSAHNSVLVYATFLITLSVLSFENFNYPMNIILVFINLSSFFLANFYYKSEFVGRFWCETAAIIPLLLLVLGELKLINY